MKKMWPVLTIALIASGAIAARAQTPASADEVVEKTLAAQGGRAALSKIHSRTMSGTIALSTPGGEITGSIDIYNKAPNKSRSVIKVDLSQFGAGQVAIDQRFDGTAGYVIDPLQGNRDITGNQLENMKNSGFPSQLLDYKARGTTIALLPNEKLLGKDAIVLQLTPKSGSPSKNYIDPQSYQLLRTVMTVNVPQLNQDVESTVDFSDFRTVDGVKLPFSTRLSSAVQNYSVSLSKVEHNVEIDDKTFSKPEK